MKKKRPSYVYIISAALILILFKNYSDISNFKTQITSLTEKVELLEHHAVEFSESQMQINKRLIKSNEKLYDMIYYHAAFGGETSELLKFLGDRE